MRSHLISTTVLALVLTLLATPAAFAQEPSVSSILFIVDASGSMWGQIDGENKIVIARRVLRGLVDELEEGSEVGMVAYGHRREGDCDDIETVVPMGLLDREALRGTIDSLNPKGKTPITESVRQAFAALRDHQGGATVVLVSDGLETCGGDPCRAVRDAKAQGIDFVMHVVGFDIADEDVSSLECAAQAGDGLFLSAENADELSGALEAAVAMPAHIPAGRLSVRVVADGELQDAAVWVSDAETGAEAGNGRTYFSEETNPRVIPLADGRYQVKVGLVGVRGDISRHFEIEIIDGSAVEHELDFSSGVLSIGVTRNGELSDAVYNITLAETGQQVAGGRTYTGERSNPAAVRITAGTYNVAIGSVEITGRPRVDLGQVTLEPGATTEVGHDFASGTLEIGAARDGELLDATLDIVSLATGTSVGGGRTYTSSSSNPATRILEPGDYEITVSQIRGERRTISVTIVQAETVERMVDPAGED